MSLSFLADTLRDLADENLLRRRRVTRWFSEGRCEIDGRTVWNLIGNDYLNLAADPRVVAAAEQALRETGVGSRASALLGGRTEWHVRLEQQIAEFEGTQAAILFPTGMAANVGTLAALIGPEDVVFCDRFNHASLIDGCRLSGAKLRVYRHDDLASLERELSKFASSRRTARKPAAPARKSSNIEESLTRAAGLFDSPAETMAEPEIRKWIVTDGVFSMDGDLAPLVELCDLADRHQALLIVDEAHATGVFGPHGRGTAEHFGVEDRVAVRIGTLSKAVGCLGGFVAGTQTLIDYLWNSARTQMYSTALPPAVCAAAAAAIGILQMEPERRDELHRRSARLSEQLGSNSIEVLAGSTGPIVPIVLNDPQRAVALADRLEAHGFLVGAIRPPTVPRGTSRLRISVNLGVPVGVLEEFAAALAAELRG